MFLWDGSDVTKILKQTYIKIRSAITDNCIYWIIENLETNRYDIIRVRTAATNHSCLIDEIKPIFGLEKIGTHWAHLDCKIYIFSKCYYKTVDGYDTIKEDTVLNDIGYMEELRIPVQNIFIFRELLGIYKNTEKNILVRSYNHDIKIIGCDEPDLKPFKKNKCISNAILEKWFNEEDVYILTEKFLKLSDMPLNEKSCKILQILGLLQSTINRVSKDLITYADEIVTRIRTRVL